MKQLKVKVIENRRLARGFYKMRLSSAYLAKHSRPGQFVEVKCSCDGEALLRRPLGVHRIWSGGIEVLYEVVGKGTKALSSGKRGDSLDVIGPLGKGFTLSAGVKPALIVAGGMGVAPLLCLAEKLAAGKIRPYVMIGAKTASRILCEKEFKKLGCFVTVATEDGSKGSKGLVTDLLRNTPACRRGGQYAIRNTIYACGPHPMLKAVSHIADSSGIPCQVSMEERMACGVGVCMGCPVKVHKTSTQYAILNTQYEYKMVCKDGPVFDAKEIAW